MKNLFLILGILISISVNAQIPVTDVAANASINSQGMGIQTKISTTNSRLNQVKNRIKDMNNDMNKRLDKMDDKLKEIQNLEQKEEDALWEVPNYVSNGNEVKSIYDSELNLISIVSDLISVISNSNGDLGRVEDFLGDVMDMLDVYMEKTIDVTTSDVYRMPVEERIKILKNVDSELKNMFTNLKNLKAELEVYNSQVNRAEERKENFNNAINKGVIIND